jgi:histidine decarboxylase
MPEDIASINADYLSRYPARCQGSNHTDRYFVAFNVSAAITDNQFSHAGSRLLDETNAFDLAEVAHMNLGQLNLVQVSSFCGPEGLIWGYDVAVPANLRDQQLFSTEDADGRPVPVYEAEPLMEAATALFGTVSAPQYPIAPGSHCPAAWKATVVDQPGTVFACLAFGIAHDRQTHACCLMEDTGHLSPALAAENPDWTDRARQAAAESVLAVMHNQGGRCREVFVSLATVPVLSGQVGCALLLAPYFRLAQQACPPAGAAALKELSLSDWTALVPFV